MRLVDPPLPYNLLLMFVPAVSRVYPAANGCRIFRFSDRSGWLLVTPTGCRMLFGIRKSAELYAEQRKPKG